MDPGVEENPAFANVSISKTADMDFSDASVKFSSTLKIGRCQVFGLASAKTITDPNSFNEVALKLKF